MTRQDEVKRIILMHTRRLQILKRKISADGPKTPPNVLMEIEDIKSKIINLQLELAGLEQTNVKLPKAIEGLYYAIKEKLNELRLTLDTLSVEVRNFPPKAKYGGIHLIRQAEQDFIKLEAEWNIVDVQSESTRETLEVLQSKLTILRSSLQILMLRRNYRRRLSLLKNQVSSQKLDFTRDQLQTILIPQMEQIREQILSLENQGHLTENDERLLDICRRNWGVCQDMISGVRPYVPLNTMSEIVELEEVIEDIDSQLAQ